MSRRALIGALALALAGRAAPQTPAPTPTATPTPTTIAAPTPTPTAPRTIAFDEAVLRARTRALGSVIALEEIRRSQGLLEQARSGSLPSLTVTGTATRLDADRRSGGVKVLPRGQTSGAAAAGLTLSPSRWFQWSHAGDQLEAARASSADAQRAAALTAGRAYLTVVAQRRVIDVSRRAVEAAQAHFDFASTRRQAGVGNLLDELRAEQQLATSGAQLEAALTGLARLQEALGQATGADEPLDAAAEPSLPLPPGDELAGDVAGRRTDVRAAGARARAAAHLARDSWADWLPSLLGSAQAWRQDWQTQASPEQGWQAQAVLSWPLFEGGLRTGQARERNALDAEAAAQLDGLLRQSRSEVRAAWAALQHAEAAFRESARAADRADRTLTLVAEAYRVGSTNSLDVSDAEQRARDAGTAAAVAEDAVRQSRLDLLAATGRFP